MRATISFNDASSAPDWMKHGDFASTLASALHAADAMRDGRLLPEEVGIVVEMPKLALSGPQQNYLRQLFAPDSRDGYCDYRTALLRCMLRVNFTACATEQKLTLSQYWRCCFHTWIESFSHQILCHGGACSP